MLEIKQLLSILVRRGDNVSSAPDSAGTWIDQCFVIEPSECTFWWYSHTNLHSSNSSKNFIIHTTHLTRHRQTSPPHSSRVLLASNSYSKIDGNYFYNISSLAFLLASSATPLSPSLLAYSDTSLPLLRLSGNIKCSPTSGGRHSKRRSIKSVTIHRPGACLATTIRL
jgi:hypothetical protein